MNSGAHQDRQQVADKVSRNHARFTLPDIRRAVKAAESAGKVVMGVHFPPEGGFTVLLETPSTKAAVLNEWDEVLSPEYGDGASDRELALARARRAARREARGRGRKVIPL